MANQSHPDPALDILFEPYTRSANAFSEGYEVGLTMRLVIREIGFVS